MGLLSDSKIIEYVKKGLIYIENFDPKYIERDDGKYEGKINPAGYNLTLNNHLKVYTEFPLDMKKENPTKDIIIPEKGLVLQPGVLYLGSVNEYIKADPCLNTSIEGRSSVARLGMAVHITAGMGDPGFEGRYTLEIKVTHPLRIYPNVPVCQIMFTTVEGEVIHPYNGKYQKSKDTTASRLFKDEVFDEDKKII